MSEEALKAWKDFYEQARKDSLPWLQGGQSAFNDIMMRLGLGGDATNPEYGSFTKRFSMADYQEDPGYKFRLQEGQKALDRGQSARGYFLSPAALKEGVDYNQGMAAQEYGSAYDRYNNDNDTIYNRLFGASGQGLQASGLITGAGQAQASGLSGIYQNMEALRQAKKASRGSTFGKIAGIGGQLASSYFGGGGSLGDLFGGGPMSNSQWTSFLARN